MPNNVRPHHLVFTNQFATSMPNFTQKIDLIPTLILGILLIYHVDSTDFTTDLSCTGYHVRPHQPDIYMHQFVASKDVYPHTGNPLLHQLILEILDFQES